MNHKNYEAPSCGELKKTVRQKDSFRWSKKDELIVLEKLLEFSSQNKNANYYTCQFYMYVNKMLSVQVSENQLCYMIYCLRKQYLDSKDDDLDWNNEIRVRVLELSERIWGGDRNEGWYWAKTKVMRDNNEQYLKDYVVEELGFPVECLSASIVEAIKKDWEHFRFVEDEFRTMQHRFTLQLCQLNNNIHNTQTSNSSTSNL